MPFILACLAELAFGRGYFAGLPKFLRNSAVSTSLPIRGFKLNGRLAMTYRAYSGPRGSEAISALDKDRLLYKEFNTLDGALAWARHANNSGRIALLIEGDDGTHLSKREIAGALHHAEAMPR